MGNNRTLKLIASAAQKLPRVDPEYAARTKSNRAKHRNRGKTIAAANARRPLKGAIDWGQALENDDEHFEVYSSIDQDDILSELEAVDKYHGADAVRPAMKLAVYVYGGKSLTLKEWADKTGIPAATISNRLRRGYTVADALTRSNDGSEVQRRSRETHRSKAKSSKRAQARRYYFDGKNLSLIEWACVTRLKLQTIISRLRMGWSIERTLTTIPSKSNRRGWVQTSSNTLRTGQLPPRDSLPK